MPSALMAGSNARPIFINNFLSQSKPAATFLGPFSWLNATLKTHRFNAGKYPML